MFSAGFARVWLVAAVSAGLLAACEHEPLPGPAAEPDQSDKRLIGGFVANDARLDAIGAMVMVPPSGPPQHLCGASVLTPETVVTAKHCVEAIPQATRAGFRIGFAIGPNVASPKQLIEVASVENAPGDEGGFIAIGRDVSVLHLDRPVKGVTPIAIGQLTDEEVGRGFAAVGYGVQDNYRVLGTRRLGRQTLKAREGLVYEWLFGSFERYLHYRRNGDVPAGDDVPPPEALPPGYEAMVRAEWERAVLLPEYEVVTGGVPGDAQPCFGDSGSPLVRFEGGRFVGYGVVSGGLGTTRAVCDLGTVYATFGPEVATFLDGAVSWVDPCGDIDVRGSCDGDVARRCTNLNEGPRRLSTFDCGLLGMTCNQGPGGQVSCDGNPTAPPRPTPPPGAAAEIQDLVARSFASPAAP
ncbi:MAG TPA: trypsin-like serine protease [Polyangia bacterium]